MTVSIMFLMFAVSIPMVAALAYGINAFDL